MSQSDQFVIQQLAAMDERLEALEAKLDRLERLEQRVNDLDARTDLLQLVDSSDDLTGKQRSIALLTHMQRKINGTEGLDRIHMTKDEVEEALHYPDIDRTTFYTDMRRCARLVGDDDVCWYESRGEGEIDDAAVYLDLSNGDLPPKVTTRSNGGA